MGLFKPKGNPHNLDVCGLEIDGRLLCPACNHTAQAEAQRNADSPRRRRRIEAIGRAVPPVARAWLRALIRREVAQLRSELPDRISQQLANELPEALDYSLARKEGSRNGTQARRG